MSHPYRKSKHDARAIGERVSDTVATTVGSWKFIILQSIAIIAWISFNTISGTKWDPYPFILLNLGLSFQAAYTAPIIMMSQNRQADIDRTRAEADFAINKLAEKEIEAMETQLSLLQKQIRENSLKNDVKAIQDQLSILDQTLYSIQKIKDSQ